MRPSFPRLAMPLATLTFVLAAPRSGSARPQGTPQCPLPPTQSGVDYACHLTASTAGNPGMPLYNQWDPNLAFVSLTQGMYLAASSCCAETSCCPYNETSCDTGLECDWQANPDTSYCQYGYWGQCLPQAPTYAPPFGKSPSGGQPDSSNPFAQSLLPLGPLQGDPDSPYPQLVGAYSELCAPMSEAMVLNAALAYMSPTTKLAAGSKTANFNGELTTIHTADDLGWEWCPPWSSLKAPGGCYTSGSTLPEVAGAPKSMLQSQFCFPYTGTTTPGDLCSPQLHTGKGYTAPLHGIGAIQQMVRMTVMTNTSPMNAWGPAPNPGSAGYQWPWWDSLTAFAGAPYYVPGAAPQVTCSESLPCPAEGQTCVSGECTPSVPVGGDFSSPSDGKSCSIDADCYPDSEHKTEQYLGFCLTDFGFLNDPNRNFLGTCHSAVSVSMLGCWYAYDGVNYPVGCQSTALDITTGYGGTGQGLKAIIDHGGAAIIHEFPYQVSLSLGPDVSFINGGGGHMVALEGYSDSYSAGVESLVFTYNDPNHGVQVSTPFVDVANETSIGGAWTTLPSWGLTPTATALVAFPCANCPGESCVPPAATDPTRTCVDLYGTHLPNQQVALLDQNGNPTGTTVTLPVHPLPGATSDGYWMNGDNINFITGYSAVFVQ